MVGAHELALSPSGLVNVTDHDSRVVRTQGQPPLQGYNAQMVVNGHQLVLAAEITTDSPDFGHLEPMVRATQRELRTIGLADPEVVLADAGYWHQRQIERIASEGMTVLVPPDGGLRKGARPGWTGGFYDAMRQRPRDTRGPRALPPAPDHDRARVRPDQVQPRDQTLPTPRPISRPQRMATDRRHPQHPQAAHPPTHGRDALNRTRRLTGPAGVHPDAQAPERPSRRLTALDRLLNHARRHNPATPPRRFPDSLASLR